MPDRVVATLRSIAAQLDAEGYVTRQGKSWCATQVMRVLNRAAMWASLACR
jgi:hypothetical protein